jgi:putative ABC transport system permease protein
MGIVAVMAAHHADDVVTSRLDWFAGLSDPVTGRVNQVMAVLTVVLVTLAAVNAIITGWATAVDARQPSALSRALGGAPRQVGLGLSAAQALPALPGAILGIPLGIVLYAVANGAGQVFAPPLPWLAGVVVGTLAAVAALTAIPAGIVATQPVAVALQAEAA